MHRIFVLIIAVIGLSSCNQNTENKPVSNDIKDEKEGEATFNNPILNQGADPWVIKHEGTYYYTHTTGNNLTLRETSNMEDLNEASPLTIWTPPQGEEYSIHIWAPELHFINGKWYMYFAATYDDGSPNSADKNRRMFVLENSSASPMNTNWEFKGKVADETDKWVIDGTVFKLEDEHYFIWSGWRTENQPENTGRQQLYIAKMKNPWRLEDSRVMISEPVYDWEKNGLVNEGPVIWKNPDGEIFLFYSGSGCWTDDYKIGVLSFAEGEDPLDPNSWKKHEEPLFKKSEANSIYAPGHNSFFKSPDGTEDWILYHANDNPGDGCGGKRKPRIQKITWNDDGFPVLGVPVKTNADLKPPSSE